MQLPFIPKEWNRTKGEPTSANFIDCTGCDPGVSASVDEVICFENGAQMNGRVGGISLSVKSRDNFIWTAKKVLKFLPSSALDGTNGAKHSDVNVETSE